MKVPALPACPCVGIWVWFREACSPSLSRAGGRPRRAAYKNISGLHPVNDSFVTRSCHAAPSPGSPSPRRRPVPRFAAPKRGMPPSAGRTPGCGATLWRQPLPPHVGHTRHDLNIFLVRKRISQPCAASPLADAQENFATRAGSISSDGPLSTAASPFASETMLLASRRQPVCNIARGCPAWRELISRLIACKYTA